MLPKPVTTYTVHGHSIVCHKLHWLLAIWTGKYFTTCLPVTDIYMGATVVSICELNSGWMHLIFSTTHRYFLQCTWPWYSLSQVHWLFAFGSTECSSTWLLVACIYTDATATSILELSLGWIQLIPSTADSNCSHSAWPHYSLSQVQWLLAFGPAEYAATCSLFTDIYMEATVVSIWESNLV